MKSKFQFLRFALVAALALVVSGVSALASTDPTDIITAASGQYNAAVAVCIGASVIGVAIYFIRKGIKGRM